MSRRQQDFETLVRERPTSHPVPFSIKYFNHDLPPSRHLQDWYHQVWRAIHDPDAQRNVALFAPRNYAKTVSTLRVIPAWLAVNFPEIRICVVSHKSKPAGKRAKTSVNTIERVCEQTGVRVHDRSKTTIQLEEGRENVEPTLEPRTIRSDAEGSHYDVVIYDDIATWGNMTTALRDTVNRNFDDFLDNVTAKDGATCLPHGSVNIVIGTRKTTNDVYREHILQTNDPDWDGFIARHSSQPDWNARVWRVTPDWHIVENEEYTVTASDGNEYETVRDVPDDVSVIDGGITPNDDFRVMWPDFHPADSVLQNIVTKSNLTVWQCENQQNPEATKGNFLQLDWLRFTGQLPSGRDDYTWYASLDFANPKNLESQSRGESSDYWALTVGAHDRENDVTFVVDQWRDRELTWEEAGEDFCEPHLREYPVETLYVESNFRGDEIADTIDDVTGLNVKKTSSSGKKEERLEAMANRFQQGRIKIADDPQRDKWESFIQDEWLSFPHSEHDDRMDSIEILQREAESSGSFADPGEVGVF